MRASLRGMCQAPAALLAQARPPIIEMHLHADLPPHDVPPGTAAVCRPEPCQGTGRATANHAETLRKSLEAMDRYNNVRHFEPEAVAMPTIVRAE